MGESVSIHNKELESGLFVLNTKGKGWIHIATTENASIYGDRIVVRSSDLHGSVTKEENI